MMIAAAALALALVASSPPSTSPRSSAWTVDASAEALVLLQADHETKGGGAGAAVALSVGELATPFLLEGSGVDGRARVGVFGGAGLAFSLELGAAWRARVFSGWEPDVGVYAGTLAGALIRGIDVHGQPAANPVALELGITPLRFRLERGFVSLLALRAGPTLGRTGAPPFFASLTLLEIGAAL